MSNVVEHKQAMHHGNQRERERLTVWEKVKKREIEIKQGKTKKREKQNEWEEKAMMQQSSLILQWKFPNLHANTHTYKQTVGCVLSKHTLQIHWTYTRMYVLFLSVFPFLNHTLVYICKHISSSLTKVSNAIEICSIARPPVNFQLSHTP